MEKHIVVSGESESEARKNIKSSYEEYVGSLKRPFDINKINEIK